MSSTRPRARRGGDSAPSATLTETPASTSRARGSRRAVKPEPEPSPSLSVNGDDEDAEGEDDIDIPEPTPSRSRPRPPAKGAAKSRSRAKGRAAPAAKEEEEDDEDEGASRPSLRGRKSVSYKEIPVEVDEDAEGEDEGLEGDSPVKPEASGSRRRGPSARLSEAPAAASPKRARRSTATGEEEGSPAPTPRVLEKIGSGRGGFSVKGAAAAAARARWDKVRRERAERGEDSDGDTPRRRPAGGGSRREVRPNVETFEEGSTITIKGVEYTIGDDEVILPDDPKGDMKIDIEGRLLGGREYKLVTFTSPSRRNPNRVYALTIDAARACGYTDSLAFLRRCPQILKLSCMEEERQMLIDIGRVTGNLKHRMVTMVCMRNVYKLMGARTVKGGKWVTDDYYEDEALEKCAENGFTPHAVAHEDEILSNALSHMAPHGRPPAQTEPMLTRSNVSLQPFYTLGGPSTQFGGTGQDPWTEAGSSHKRARLKNLEVTETDWMYRLAEESRALDQTLREYRDERLKELEGEEKKRGWVWAVERATDKLLVEDDVGELKSALLGVARLERRRSTLSQVVAGPEDEEKATSAPVDETADVSMEEAPAVEKTAPERAGEIIVQSEADQAAHRPTLGSWRPGSVRAAYEPHTQMPHIPLYTQPTVATLAQTSAIPALDVTDIRTVNRWTVKGLASIEYIFEDAAGTTDGAAESETQKRLREVAEAEGWERRARRQRTSVA